MDASCPQRPLGRRSKLLATGATAAVAAALVLSPGAAYASSHREAPLTAGDPQIDNTDVYAFTSPDKPDTVTLIANWIPFEAPNGGPNFYPFAPDAHYDINIDNTGGAKANITYRWTFTSHYRDATTFLYNTGPVNNLTDPTLNFYQTYTLQKIVNGGAPTTLLSNVMAAPSDTGLASMPNYATLRDQAIKTDPQGGRSYAGQADDPFFLDLRIFDLLYGANLKESGVDSLSGYNVNTIAYQVPKSEVEAGGDGSHIIGVWSTTERQTLQLSPGKATPTGGYVQVSRLGNPLVNEVVVPVGAKDLFNSSQPSGDSQFLPGVTDPIVPKLIQKVYGLPAPKAPRNDLVSVFLTGVKGLNMPPKVAPSEELRLNLAIPPSASPNRLGVLAGDKAGFPNGRRLADDVVDIELQALEGAVITGKLVPALAAGDGVNTNDVPFGQSFPYVALPHAGVGGTGGSSGSTGSSSSTTPTGGAATGGGGTAAPRSQSLPTLPITAGVAALLLIAGGALTRRRNNG